MKALVTGGDGFLGRYVVDALVSQGISVRVVTRSDKRLSDVAEYFEADLCTSESLTEAFSGIDVLVHLAMPMTSRGTEQVEETIVSTRRLLCAMKLSEVRKIVLASSFSVYDWLKIDDEVNENCPILSTEESSKFDDYTAAKVAQESYVKAFARKENWDLTVLRPAVVWGKESSGRFLLGPTLGLTQLVIAPSSPIRLVYAENAALAFALAAARPFNSGQWILNVIDEAGPTAWEHAQRIRGKNRLVHFPVPFHLLVFAARLIRAVPVGSLHLPYFCDPYLVVALHKPVRWNNTALRSALGWQPLYDYETALQRTVEDT